MNGRVDATKGVTVTVIVGVGATDVEYVEHVEYDQSRMIGM